jgi:hypothetical protein
MARERTAAWLLAALVLACRAGPSREPSTYVCEGRTPPVPPGSSGTVGAEPVLEVAVLDAGPRATVPHLRSTDWDQLGAVRLSVRARMVPLGRLAAELGAALQANLLVDRRLVDVAVSLTLPDVTLAQLVEILEETHPLRATHAWGTLAFESEYTIQQRAVRGAELEPTDTRVIAVADSRRSHQIAALFCSHFASPRGSATVVSDSIVVSDSGDRVRGFLAFLREHGPW